LLPIENLKTLVPVQESSLEIEIPYTFGKHILKVSHFHGNVFYDSLNNSFSSGTISVDVEDFKTKDKTLLCHFLEAMTLDYKASDYPGKHVCDNDELPATGKNSPVFKVITATLTKPSHLSETSLNINWQIRGIEKSLALPVKMTWSMENQILNLTSEWKMSRADFNIIVKKFLFISVEDKLNLKLNLKLGIVP
jgi:hypothetical protein